MDITKELLLEYRNKKQEIKELEYRLNNRYKEESMLGNDVIFDYSKGYPMPQSVVGFDSKRYEYLQNRDRNKKAKLEKECRAMEDFVEEIESSEIRRIFRLYFIEGEKKPTQSEIAWKLHIDRSRISRKIDDFLKNAHKAQKAHL